MPNKRRVKILDTTLRDGEQTPRVALAPDQKIEIAQALDDLGVDIIEAGSPMTSEGEREAIKSITKAGLSSEICSYVRGVKSDIDAALACDVDSVHLVLPTSDIHLKYKLKKSKTQLREMAAEMTRYALDHGLTVELSAEDATRSDPDFLKEFLSVGVAEGAQRACVCDTVGVLTPEQTFGLFTNLVKAIKIALSIHAHDDLGMATANSLAAVRAGAQEVHVTINGLGERAGNAALEEVVLALSRFYKIKTNIKLKKLYGVSRLIESHTGLPVSPTKAIVGENVFMHEAGIHTHGVLAYPPTYEPLSPEIVGQRRKMVFGKHVGSHAIRNELQRMGLKPTEEQVREIFEQIKRLGDRGKLVTDVEWRAIEDTVMGRTLEDIVRLDELTVVSGNRVTSTASVRLRYGDKEVSESGIGVGPVDAAIKAVRKVIEEMSDIRLKEYHVDAISGGSDALVDVVVKLTDGRRIISSRGSSGDIVMASVQAMLRGINRLLWDRKRRAYGEKRKP